MIASVKGSNDADKLTKASRNVFRAVTFRKSMFRDFGHNSEYIIEDDEIEVAIMNVEKRKALKKPELSMGDTKEQRSKKMALRGDLVDKTEKEEEQPDPNEDMKEEEIDVDENTELEEDTEKEGEQREENGEKEILRKSNKTIPRPYPTIHQIRANL